MTAREGVFQFFKFNSTDTYHFFEANLNLKQIPNQLFVLFVFLSSSCLFFHISGAPMNKVKLENFRREAFKVQETSLSTVRF